MGRLGYSLLTLGLAFVWLGWYYHAEWATVPGLILLASLTVLELLRVDTTPYDLVNAGLGPKDPSMARVAVYFAFYAFAGVAFLAAVAHTQAGGDGVMTAGTFVALGILLALYDFLPTDATRSRTLDQARRSSEQHVE